MSNVISLQLVYSDKICRQTPPCLCESKAKFPILEALAYFISWVHPHYGRRLRSLRIPSLWCVRCMQFHVSQASYGRQWIKKEMSRLFFSLLVQTTRLLSYTLSSRHSVCRATCFKYGTAWGAAWIQQSGHVMRWDMWQLQFSSTSRSNNSSSGP